LSSRGQSTVEAAESALRAFHCAYFSGRHLCYDHHVNVYNTLSGAVETIEPSGRALTLYVCGITPYTTTHFGPALPYPVADVSVRHLESRGLTVRYVQNVTDIDDDILRKAAEI